MTVDPHEDPGFGFYSARTALWDEIAHNAPFYLIFKSAGNDRNDVGPDSGTHLVWNYLLNDWERFKHIPLGVLAVGAVLAGMVFFKPFFGHTDQVAKFYGEEISTDPTKVRPQHLGPNDKTGTQDDQDDKVDNQ